jgi:hypothetical protein
MPMHLPPARSPDGSRPRKTMACRMPRGEGGTTRSPSAPTTLQLLWASWRPEGLQPEIGRCERRTEAWTRTRKAHVVTLPCGFGAPSARTSAPASLPLFLMRS